jgi:hypothetical protein
VSTAAPLRFRSGENPIATDHNITCGIQYNTTVA